VKKWMLCLVITFFLCCSFLEMSAAGDFVCSNVEDGFKMIVDYDSERPCNVYVRYETEIEHKCCNGLAKECYDQAASCGYSVGSMPQIGSIMVMDAWGDNTAGHAAIVIDINSQDSSLVKVRDSNWLEDEYTREHWIDTDTNGYKIKGYIYCDDGSPDPPSLVAYRRVGNVAWYPPNKSCRFAEKWRSYTSYPDGGMTLGNNAICDEEEYNMMMELGGVYSDYWNIIFGWDDLDNLDVCSQ